jgi:hypothetical protein
MRNVDEILRESMSEEERQLLARLPEPGLFGSAVGLFTGRLGWVNVVLMLVQGVAFLGGAYAAWRFFEAGDPVNQLRWGLPAMTLLLMSGLLKAMMWPAVHADRVIREVKRLELRLADAVADRRT